ncbi:MAG TPA: hypothetical protein VHG91_09905 [Longimicrobium sp.]|nr:hypothetical protein [Longimicrobium sp.]
MVRVALPATAVSGAYPEPGSAEELARLSALQRGLPPLFRDAFPDRAAPQTVVVVPGMTLDAAELRKLEGAPHYEERLLCLLVLLRRPRTRGEDAPAEIRSFALL